MIAYTSRLLSGTGISMRDFIIINHIQNTKSKYLFELNLEQISCFILPILKYFYSWMNNITPCIMIVIQKLRHLMHLIFECSYAKAIWREVHNVVEENISLEMILFGFNSRNDVNFMLSIVVCSIYKEWLICSYEKKLRKTEPNFSMYKAEFLYRKRLYEHCRHAEFSNICQLLEKLISCISQFSLCVCLFYMLYFLYLFYCQFNIYVYFMSLCMNIDDLK